MFFFCLVVGNELAAVLAGDLVLELIDGDTECLALVRDGGLLEQMGMCARGDGGELVLAGGICRGKEEQVVRGAARGALQKQMMLCGGGGGQEQVRVRRTGGDDGQMVLTGRGGGRLGEQMTGGSGGGGEEQVGVGGGGGDSQ